MSIVVPGYGRRPNRVMFVGEAPGESEAFFRDPGTGRISPRPFVGRAGKEQDAYLRAAGIVTGVSTFYRTNVVKDYIEGNPDPTPELIAEWEPALLAELEQVQPDIVIAVGRFAARWFLGDDADMDFVHGIAFKLSYVRGLNYKARFDKDLIVVSTYHPAYGFYDDEARPLIFNDYRAAAAAIKHRPNFLADDALVGYEEYRDVTGTELADIVASQDPGPFGMDTEGVPGDEWSVQTSFNPGIGYVLRKAQPDFAIGIAALQRHSDIDDNLVCLHNGMYDIEMVRNMGWDLFEARLFDSMYAAYIMRTEPQGLKPLAYRWCGMAMQSYLEVVGDIGLEKQMLYLSEVMDREWPKPEARVEYENDGTFHLYTPQPVNKRAYAILNDYYSGKRDKEGNLPDPLKRWKKVDRDLRRLVEAEMGPMPVGRLGDIPLVKAVGYSGRDPDATLRLYYTLEPELRLRKLSQLMQDGMDVLPVFEEMQSNGMPARRSHFEQLSVKMWDEMCRLQARISHRYYGGKPFNPASSDQVAALMRRRGLHGEKRSKKTGKVSTGKKSIEHLRYEDEAIGDVIDWREHQKIRDAFCDPIVELMTEEYQNVRCTIKTTRVASRRISASDPNLTAIPVRNELGLEVRAGYEAPEGYVIGSWDLSQIEMRYMAHVSRDPLMCKFFNEKNPVTGKDFDIHAETAARIFGMKIEDVDEMQHRYPSKRAGFGIITNIAGAGLFDQLRMFGCKGWSVDKCDDLIKEWLNVYKGVRAYLDSCKREVREKGFVVDCWGMPRFLPGVWSDDKKVRAEAERAASSMKIQGGAQGMLQKSMAWLKGYIRGLRMAGEDVRWLLQIHDEILLMFREELWDTIDPLVREGLTEHSLKLIVPVKCSGTRHRKWSEL